MKIVQIGCGAVGLVTARHLIESKKIDEIVLADIAIEKAAQLVKSLKSEKKATVKKADASDRKALKNLFKGCDLVINGAIPRFNENVMLAALDADANYMDFAMGDEFDQFTLNEKFKAAGLGALISMGEDPGITDAMAMSASKQLDEVDKILVRDGDNASVPGYKYVALFSPDTLIDETLCKPLIYKDGKWDRMEPFSGEEEYPFPAPIGKLKVYFCDHEEPMLMPKYINTKYCDFKIALDPDYVRITKVLHEVGLTSPKPIEIKGCKVAPRDVVTYFMPKPADLAGKVKGYGCVLVEVHGKKGGKKKRIKMWTVISHEEAYRLSGMHATGYLVGTPGAAAAIMWADGKIKQKGVFPPEMIDTDEFLRRLPEFNINIGQSIEDL
ncbi:MAG: saccharopine dehydrogenase NADP-binding domain-containing protein [Thermoplasmata archaeon]|nr:saccharopine dehydrogenase NADP-binding domain-containing protein [Thermoplasmata archaeon]